MFDEIELGEAVGAGYFDGSLETLGSQSHTIASFEFEQILAGKRSCYGPFFSLRPTAIFEDVVNRKRDLGQITTKIEARKKSHFLLGLKPVEKVTKKLVF